MKHGKQNRNTDIENVVKELNMLKKRVRDYEKIFFELKKRTISNRHWMINASEHIRVLEKQLEQLAAEGDR